MNQDFENTSQSSYSSPYLNEEEPPSQSKSASTRLVIRSQATPVVGVIMLVVGLLAGYFGRGLISAVAGDNRSSADLASVSITIPTTNADRAAQQEELMSTVLENTRHLRGNPDAPITVVEFSDFQ